VFEPTSRYYALETVTTTFPDGRVATYKRRRFAPHSESMRLLQEAFVGQGERLDLITARTLGDPEQFWRICDANEALDPSSLTGVPGRALRIPIPER
jgi:hypothetical protein